MEKKYTLSFILSTRNRLPFLKITLGKLLEEVLPDEEIVVVDGNSTDGTKEYLQGLYEAGEIHQFISEPDKNQAHGWNKAMLLARGELIKKIIDDDVFCYSAIRECKNYMLANSDADVCISNDLSSDLNNYNDVQRLSRYSQFLAWKENKVPSFTFGDVHLLIKKNSLAYIGLYNTGFVMMDWEYSLRLSYLKANIVYYTGYNALSVSHPGTVSAQKNNSELRREGEIGKILYEYSGDSSDISLWSKIKIYIGKLIYNKRLRYLNQEEEVVENIQTKYQYFYKYVNQLNLEEKASFL